MSLVAYGDSDSEDEVEENSKDDSVGNKHGQDKKIERTKTKSVEKKPKVKISIPSLSEFVQNNDEDQSDNSASKQKAPRTKASGLLALLPPVQNAPLSNKTFVPKQLVKPTSTTTTLIPHSVQKKTKETSKKIDKKLTADMKPTALIDDESDDDDSIATSATFFDDDLWQKVCGRPTPKKSSAPLINSDANDETVNETDLNSIVDCAPEPEKPYDGLDNEAFKNLVGRHQRPHLNYKLIDIDETDVVSVEELHLMRSITDPTVRVPASEMEITADTTKKRKHHITYLAEKAKANEQELQAQWSSNKFAKMQTRAKYGF